LIFSYNILAADEGMMIDKSSCATMSFSLTVKEWV